MKAYWGILLCSISKGPSGTGPIAGAETVTSCRGGQSMAWRAVL